MFTQFSEISARFIQADKSKGVKRLLLVLANPSKSLKTGKILPSAVIFPRS